MRTPPPYLRIAQEIRDRIGRGELPVGDRAPSTRAIAGEWKVAMATAAHALRVLAEDGTLRVVPRVGSIVAGPRPPSPGKEARAGAAGASELTRAAIVDCAIAIADGEGLAAVSVRAVASKIGTPVMSLYRHVPSKADLLRLMTDAALSHEPLPASSPEGWRAQLDAAPRAEWRVFRRHPWLARVMSLTRPEPLPSAIAYADWVLGALASTGASADTQLRIHILLHSYVQGFAVNVESESEAAGETGQSDAEWMQERAHAFAALAASGRYPSFSRVLGELGEFELDLDALFERGLAALLDGLTPSLTSARADEPGGPGRPAASALRSKGATLKRSTR